jgi:hypothetical protein
LCNKCNSVCKRRCTVILRVHFLNVFFILSWPRGTRRKKLQILDSMNQRINRSEKVNLIETFLYELGGKTAQNYDRMPAKDLFRENCNCCNKGFSTAHPSFLAHVISSKSKRQCKTKRRTIIIFVVFSPYFSCVGFYNAL